MASQNRRRTGFTSGTITNNPLAIGGTTLNSSELSSFPEVTTGQRYAVVLDPQGLAGAPEIIHITLHSASATSATIERGQEGTTARQHAQTIPWVHGPTLQDFGSSWGGNLEVNAGTNLVTLPNSYDDYFTLQADSNDLEGIVAPLLTLREIGRRVRFTVNDSNGVVVKHNADATYPIRTPGLEDMWFPAESLLEFISVGIHWKLIGWTGPYLAGQNTSEGTSTSTSPAVLLTVSDLNIPVNQPVRIIGLARKTTGAAAAVALGLRINSTDVITPNSGGGSEFAVWKSSAVNVAENGLYDIRLGPRIASYEKGGFGIYGSEGLDPDGKSGDFVYVAANMPVARITSISITGDSGSASVTMATRNIRVYVG